MRPPERGLDKSSPYARRRLIKKTTATRSRPASRPSADPALAPTVTQPPATPTPTSVPPTETPSLTPQPPRVQADRVVNVRGGPGTSYPVVGHMQAEETRDIIRRNANGDWWRVAWGDQGQAWVAGRVVNVLGPIDAVAVAQDIPTHEISPQPVSEARAHRFGDLRVHPCHGLIHGVY